MVLSYLHTYSSTYHLFKVDHLILFVHKCLITLLQEICIWKRRRMRSESGWIRRRREGKERRRERRGMKRKKMGEEGPVAQVEDRH